MKDILPYLVYLAGSICFLISSEDWLTGQGVHLRVMLREGHIDVGWDSAEFPGEEVAMIPQHHQSVRLVNQRNMYGKIQS